MNDQTPQKKKVTRSPGYPALSLREAIEKATVLYEKEKRHPAPLTAIESHFGFKIGGGTVSRVISALGKFGLVDDEGQLAEKQYKLSESALTIILSPPNAPERSAAIKNAALLPTLHREIWDLYGGQLPSDETLKSYLLLKRGFNPGFVDDFLKNFRDTIDFAGLLSDNSSPKATPDVPEKPTFESTSSATPIMPSAPLNLSTRNVITRPNANVITKEFNFPLDDENDVDLRFFGTAFGIEQLEALSDVIDFLKTRFRRKATPPPPPPSRDVSEY